MSKTKKLPSIFAEVHAVRIIEGPKTEVPYSDFDMKDRMNISESIGDIQEGRGGRFDEAMIQKQDDILFKTFNIKPRGIRFTDIDGNVRKAAEVAKGYFGL